jgi:hypothetical protein
VKCHFWRCAWDFESKFLLLLRNSAENWPYVLWHLCSFSFHILFSPLFRKNMQFGNTWECTSWRDWGPHIHKPASVDTCARWLARRGGRPSLEYKFARRRLSTPSIALPSFVSWLDLIFLRPSTLNLSLSLTLGRLVRPADLLEKVSDDWLCLTRY